MARLLKISPIFILLISFALDIEAQSKGWQQITPKSYSSLATNLQKPLSAYLHKSVVVQRIITAADNNDVADNHLIVYFVEVQESCEQTFYTVNAYIGFAGRLTVSYARRYGL